MKAWVLTCKGNSFKYGVILARSLEGAVATLCAKKVESSPFPNEFRIPKKTLVSLGINSGTLESGRKTYYLDEITLLSY